MTVKNISHHADVRVIASKMSMDSQQKNIREGNNNNYVNSLEDELVSLEKKIRENQRQYNMLVAENDSIWKKLNYMTSRNSSYSGYNRRLQQNENDMAANRADMKELATAMDELMKQKMVLHA